MLIGNAGKDPEITVVKGDKKVTKFSIAVNEYGGKDESGARVTTAMWVNIVAWEKNAENLAKYLKKGNKVAIIGRLSIREYTDKDGNKRYATEVIVDEFEFLTSKGENSENSTSTTSSSPAPAPAPAPAMAENASAEADDLPF